MSFPKEKKRPMEKGTGGKTKTVASIPDNYVSILQLQERWMKEKEGRQKERDLEVKQQQVNEQRRREEKEEPKCVEKEEAEEEDGEYAKERRKKWSKKKSQGGSVKEVFKCGSKAYFPVKEETPGEKIVKHRETAACNPTAVETQFQHPQIKKRVEEYKEVKGPARLNSGQGYYRNQTHETRTMVWVRKGENNGASSGVNGAVKF